MRIVIVKLSSLGDLFHALPAVHALKTGLGAEVDWVTQSEYADLVRCFTDVSDVIPFSRRSWMTGFKEAGRVLRARRYDLAIDLQGLLKSALVMRLARAPRRIGPSFHREGSRWFYTEVAGRPDKQRHAVEEMMDVVRYLGLPDAGREFPVSFPSVPLGSGRPRIGLLPVSRWPSKNWPPAGFVEVARRLQDTVGAAIYLLGGPGDVEVCRSIADQLNGDTQVLAGRTHMVQLGGILGGLDLLISNDSGPVHMAAAIGTPTLVVFGPTDPARTGPYGTIHRVVEGHAPCRPCFSRVCRHAGMPCFASVTPVRVADVAFEMLRAPTATRSADPPGRIRPGQAENGREEREG